MLLGEDNVCPDCSCFCFLATANSVLLDTTSNSSFGCSNLTLFRGSKGYSKQIGLPFVQMNFFNKSDVFVCKDDEVFLVAIYDGRENIFQLFCFFESCENDGGFDREFIGRFRRIPDKNCFCTLQKDTANSLAQKKLFVWGDSELDFELIGEQEDKIRIKNFFLDLSSGDVYLRRRGTEWLVIICRRDGEWWLYVGNGQDKDWKASNLPVKEVVDSCSVEVGSVRSKVSLKIPLTTTIKPAGEEE